MKKAALIVLILALARGAMATTLERGVPAVVSHENPPVSKEAYRLRIENRVDGLIEVSQDKGQSWRVLGRVLYPTDKVSRRGYAAARWVSPGRVSATAVNAIHIKVGSPEVERTIFSILPREFLKPPGRYRSFLSPDSSIYTDIKAGAGIFGGGFSPFVGNPVMVSRLAEPIRILPEGFVPEVGDTFYILVDKPTDLPSEMVFENRFGGRITVKYLSGEEKTVGEVLRPVSGVGRFEGSAFTGPGRIRANHAGVICVSVSPLGSHGGFQIVPALHAQNMNYVKKMTQWMVIGPPGVEDPSLEGIAPFYKFFIQPNYRPADLEDSDWENKLLSRYLVEVRYDGSDEWQAMPVYALRRDFRLPWWTDSVFDKVSHFRILFPIAEQ